MISFRSQLQLRYIGKDTLVRNPPTVVNNAQVQLQKGNYHHPSSRRGPIKQIPARNLLYVTNKVICTAYMVFSWQYTTKMCTKCNNILSEWPPTSFSIRGLRIIYEPFHHFATNLCVGVTTISSSRYHHEFKHVWSSHHITTFLVTLIPPMNCRRCCSKWNHTRNSLQDRFQFWSCHWCKLWSIQAFFVGC